MARRLVPLLLALAVLAPYYQLLAGLAIPIPDDIFISDMADGDLPLRVEVGRILRAGELPLWTSGVWTGYPLQTGAFEPFSLALFAALPPALALGWYIALWLLAAALGTYALARRLGASRAGGFLAGFAFAWSGFFVSQLRHLGTIVVVALFPAALYCLERSAGAGLDAAAARALPLRRRLLWLAGFATLFGLQLLGGFPQSAYNAALLYAALVAARCIWLLKPAAAKPARTLAKPAAGFAAGALGAAAVGALLGMVQLLPLWELGRLSDRSGGGTLEWATYFNYWPRNALTFLIPYANGDISDLTYTGRSVFWEDYGYVGLATLLLAFAAAIFRLKRFPVAFWSGAALVAYGLVLGKVTPLYGIAFKVVPGLSTFRFPTRFLFIVELALALLGGLGLTFLEELLSRRLSGGSRRFVAPVVAFAFAAGTAADLVYHNRRQNPLVDADRWLARPASAAAILGSAQTGRVYSPGTRQQHTDVFYRAGGWSGDLGPYLAHRDLLQPNANLLHGVEALNGYAGIEPRWTVDLIGDHNRAGLVDNLHRFDRGRLLAGPAFFDLLEALAVRWLLLPSRVASSRLEHVASTGAAEVYRLPAALPRARVLEQARVVASAGELLPQLANRAIDLRRELVLHEAAAAVAAAGGAGSAGSVAETEAGARIVVDRATEVAVEAVAPRGGWLLLADTWYPGWEAAIDGRPAPILRANVAHRAVPLPPGSHRVVFRFRPRSVRNGMLLSLAGAVLLAGAAMVLARREPRA